MKKIVNILFFVFIFIKSVFSMQEPLLENALPYDEEDLSLVKLYSKNQELDNFFENKNLKEILLSQRNLSNIKLKDSSLEGVQLSEISFVGATLEGLACDRSHFSGINFVGATLMDVNFHKSVISSSIFSLSEIANSDFSKAEITNSKFTSMKEEKNGKIKCFFYKNKLDFSAFQFCTFNFVGFRDVSFFGTSIKSTIFKNCTFSNINFMSASLDNVLFENCIFLDCEHLDKIFYVNNIVFNLCEFLKTGFSENDIMELIIKIERFDVDFIKQPTVVECFKNIAGALVVPALRIGTSFLTGASYEFGRAVMEACKKSFNNWKSSKNKNSSTDQ